MHFDEDYILFGSFLQADSFARKQTALPGGDFYTVNRFLFSLFALKGKKGVVFSNYYLHKLNFFVVFRETDHNSAHNFICEGLLLFSLF